jgi:MFS family permease
VIIVADLVRALAQTVLGVILIVGHPGVATVALLAAVGGAGLIIFDSLWETSVQRHIPEDRLSRASSYDYFGSLVAYPVGLAVAGSLADAVGLDRLLWAVGVGIVVLIILTFLPRSVRGLADPPAAQAVG